MTDRRDRLAAAHLYLVCDAVADAFLGAALRGGVEIVQLRMKSASDEEILRAAHRVAKACAEHGALFILNDRPDLVARSGADGVHVGQVDMPVARARRIVGRDRLVGLSTHSADQVDDAAGQDLDYIGVGPVHETPTKPGRPAVGLSLVRYAAAHTKLLFFAIGGITAANAPAVRAAGAGRIAVVRALTEASDPERAARVLLAAVAGDSRTYATGEVGVGSA